MEKKRIGKTLKIRWAILTGGEPEPLAGRDLTLEISSGNRVRTTLSFVADGNVAAFVFEGSEQRYVGTYAVTMWENLGKEGQTVVDRCDAFCLVARSCEEAESGSSEDPDLEIESLDLGTSNFEAGVPGASAYELFKKYNPDSELTEEEYAESPIQAAGAALAMVEQLEETEAAMKQAEQLRKQAEQGREASEQARATAEQARVTAEQQRALAEQTRVTNESARQTAEAGRQAAETKREENTAEAIRNSEEATKKAEDEASRVRALADNPPKIVEVDGAKYWAFWDEETGRYVPSENRADVGDAVLFSPQVLTPQQQEQARKNIGGDNSYISFINGQTPIQGIRYVDIKDYPKLSGNYTGVFYDEDQQEIYCLCDGFSATGGVVKISKNKVVAYLNMDVSSNGCERPIVKIGEYLYVIQLGWIYNGMLSKLNANDLSLVLQVTDSDKIGYNTPKGGLFFIGEELYLWGMDGVFYSVNKEDLSFTPVFSNIQYVLQFDYTRLVIADDTDIFEFTGGTEKGNSKPIPEGFETISELAIGGIGYNITNGAFIYIRNGSIVTSFYTISAIYGGGKLTLSTRYSSNSSRIYSCRKLYNDTGGHDSNVFRDKRGVLYVSNTGNGKLSSTPSITVDALGLNAGPYLFGSTPIYPTYRGFLM